MYTQHGSDVSLQLVQESKQIQEISDVHSPAR